MRGNESFFVEMGKSEGIGLRIAICDKSQEQRDTLLHLIRVGLAGEPFSYQVREYACVQALLDDIRDGENVDVVFVDVAMSGGWEGVNTLRWLRFDGDLILMSDKGERAVEGYAVEADGYLLKPFDPSAVQRLLLRLCAHAPRACLTVNMCSRIVRVPYHEILYIESRNAKCVIHRTDGAQYTVYTQLDDLERALRDARFLRCHQSFLVNMDHVADADKQFTMTNGDIVSIRQRDRHRLRERYRAYLRSIDV